MILPNFAANSSNKKIEPIAVSKATAAKMLSVCERTIDNLVKAGRLRCAQIGRRVVFSIQELHRFLDESQTQAFNRKDGEI